MAPPEPPISDKDLQVIPGLRVQLSFRFYCLYNAILTSRTLTNHRDGYLLSIGDRKRVPPFKRLTIGIDPLPGVQGDDREIGEKILFLSDHRPFRTPGVLLMSMEGMCGYYLPSDVTPNGLVTLIRNLHGHLDGRGVSGYYQVSPIFLRSEIQNLNSFAVLISRPMVFIRPVQPRCVYLGVKVSHAPRLPFPYEGHGGRVLSNRHYQSPTDKQPAVALPVPYYVLHDPIRLRCFT